MAADYTLGPHVYEPGHVQELASTCRHCRQGVDHETHAWARRRGATPAEVQAIAHLRAAARLLHAEGRNGHVAAVQAADRLTGQLDPASLPVATAHSAVDFWLTFARVRA